MKILVLAALLSATPALEVPCAQERRAVAEMQKLMDGATHSLPSFSEILRRRQKALKECLAAFQEREV